MTDRTTDDYDNPWKAALETYFQAFMAFFFPDAYAEIDWARGYAFLDTELQQVTRDAEQGGPRRVDKLVRVWLLGGGETWLLVHIEVQSQDESGFALRMYVYHYRLFDRYDREVVSLAVLADEQPGWRPQHFEQARWGCRVQFTFPIAKLLDYQARWAELEASDNPFATVVMAHLQTQATRHNPDARARWKFTLVRRLYERGYARADILQLFHFLDWMMRLPEELEERFWQALQTYEQEQQMHYISPFEKRAVERGWQQGHESGLQQGLQEGEQKGRQEGLQEGEHTGLLQGIALALELKFGEAGLALLPDIQALRDLTLLQRMLTAIKTASTLDELRQIYRAEEPPETPRA